jgi:hypothetical protein
VARWHEEVLLVVEEMRRVLWFFWWKRMSWMKMADQREDLRPDLQEGLAGYAAKQAAVLDNLGTWFANDWYVILLANGLETEWLEKYVGKWKGFVADTGSVDFNNAESGEEDEGEYDSD